MGILVLSIVFLLTSAAAFYFIKPSKYNNITNPIRYGISGVCLLVSLCLFISLHLIIIPQESTGHMKRIYGGDSLPTNRVIANFGQRGPQAKILTVDQKKAGGFSHPEQSRTFIFLEKGVRK